MKSPLTEKDADLAVLIAMLAGIEICTKGVLTHTGMSALEALHAIVSQRYDERTMRAWLEESKAAHKDDFDRMNALADELEKAKATREASLDALEVLKAKTFMAAEFVNAMAGKKDAFIVVSRTGDSKVYTFTGTVPPHALLGELRHATDYLEKVLDHSIAQKSAAPPS